MRHSDELRVNSVNCAKESDTTELERVLKNGQRNVSELAGVLNRLRNINDKLYSTTPEDDKDTGSVPPSGLLGHLIAVDYQTADLLSLIDRELSRLEDAI